MRDWPLRLMLKKTNHHHTSTLSGSSALYMTVRAPLRGSDDIMPCKCVTPVHPHPTLSGALVGAQKPETRHTHINPSEQGSMSVVMFLISTLAWPPARRKYRDWNSFSGINTSARSHPFSFANTETYFQAIYYERHNNTIPSLCATLHLFAITQLGLAVSRWSSNSHWGECNHIKAPAASWTSPIIYSLFTGLD